MAIPPQPAKQQITLAGLALTFLKIGIIGFGGGMAIVALMEHELIRKRHVMEAEEFLHGVGLGQILGPFAVNAALFTGYRLFGVSGGLISACAFMAPSFILVLVLSWAYFSYHAIPALQGAVAGLGPIVIALILSAAWSMGRRAVQTWLAVLLCAAAIVAGVYKTNPVYVLVTAGMIGLILGPRLERIKPVAAGSDRETGKNQGRNSAFPWLLPVPGTVGAVSLAKLGITFFTTGLVFFGGGFVLVPVLHQTLVVKLAWLSSQEFVDGVAISNLTPGPIAVLAIFAGYRLGGIAGALTASIALYLPAAILMLALSHEYGRLKGRKETQVFLAGILPAVIGLVLSSAILLAPGTLHSWRGVAFAGFALLLLIRWKLHPVYVLAIGAAAGSLAVLP